MPAEDSIGLYIHVPFCWQKCHYCDFYSLPLGRQNPGGGGENRSSRRIEGLFSLYRQALWRELDLYLELLPLQRGSLPRLKSIYLGGGTPTVLGGEMLAEIIERCRAAFPPGEEPPETTVEANPGTFNRNDLRCLREVGVNRISLGVQSFNPRLLETLGRQHSREQALAALEKVREAGFTNINLDLMLGLPGQTIELLKDDLEQITALFPEHLSAYLLKVEPATPLHQRLRAGELILPSEEEAAEMYLTTAAVLEAAGYRQYEISNFACDGYQSKHNLIYWSNQEYLGLGPAAHSALRAGSAAGGALVRRENLADLEKYAEKVGMGEFPLASEEVVTREWEIAETMFLGQRTTAGVKFEEFKSRFGKTIDEVYPGVISRLSQAGLLFRDSTGVRLTKNGQLLANEVFIAFLPPQ